MKKNFLVIVIMLLVLSQSVYATASYNSLEEKETQSRNTLNDVDILFSNPQGSLDDIKEKGLEKQKSGDYINSNYSDFYKNLRVPHFEQQNGYYCGPASVKMVADYLNGNSYSQSYYANELGTTRDGTDMTLISGVLNNETSAGYRYYSFNNMSEWLGEIKYALTRGYPVIADIDTRGYNWGYQVAGHYIVISGLDLYYDGISPYSEGEIENKVNRVVQEVKINDSNTRSIYWKNMVTVYDVNRNHFRSALICK